MQMRQRFHCLLLLTAPAMLVACTSPEAQRMRGGGPGADVGNHDSVVEMHGGAQPYYQTPQLLPSLKKEKPHPQ
ncbi:MAG: hypothetical protein ACRERD_27030 [Candidatus Binatia bacterium]